MFLDSAQGVKIFLRRLIGCDRMRDALSETAMGNQSNTAIRAEAEIRASRCVQTSIPLWRYLAQRYLVNFCRREEKDE